MPSLKWAQHTPRVLDPEYCSRCGEMVTYAWDWYEEVVRGGRKVPRCQECEMLIREEDG